MSLSFKRAKSNKKAGEEGDEQDPYATSRKRVKYLDDIMNGRLGFQDVVHNMWEMDADLVDISLDDDGKVRLKYPKSPGDPTLASFSYAYPPLVVESCETRAPGYKSDEAEDKFAYKYNVTVTELPVGAIVRKQCVNWRELQKKSMDFRSALQDRIADFIVNTPGLYPKYRADCQKAVTKTLTKKGNLPSDERKALTKAEMAKELRANFHNVMPQFVPLPGDDEVFQTDMDACLKSNPRCIKAACKVFVDNKTGEVLPEEVNQRLKQDPNDESALVVEDAYNNKMRLRTLPVRVEGVKEQPKYGCFDNKVNRGETVRIVASPFPWNVGVNAGVSEVLKTVSVLVRVAATAEVKPIDNSMFVPKGLFNESKPSAFAGLAGDQLAIAQFISARDIAGDSTEFTDITNAFSNLEEDAAKAAIQGLVHSEHVVLNNDGSISTVSGKATAKLAADSAAAADTVLPEDDDDDDDMSG